MGCINNISLWGCLSTILIALCRFVKMEECAYDELVVCTEKLSKFSEFSGLSFLSKKSDMEVLCLDLKAGLECIRSYTIRCMNADQRQHFNLLYHGTGELIHELCEDDQYQRDFLQHAPCMLHMQNKYEDCSKHYQETIANLPEPISNSTSNAVEDLCCSFREYISCTEHIVKHTCGKDAAYFARSILDRISFSLMRLHCEQFKPKPGKCGEPYYSFATSLHSTTTTALLIFAISNIYLILIPNIF